MAVIGYNAHTKMHPPLRGPENVEAVKRGFADDVIDAIATDHAPYTSLGKSGPFEKAPFGIIGLETAVPLILSLVRQGVTIPAAARNLSYELGENTRSGGRFFGRGSTRRFGYH
jgi:dihydroorotase-like cyclic amidohydrolase